MRYLLEYNIDTCFDDTCGVVKLVRDEVEIEIDFIRKDGYREGQKIKFILEEENRESARLKAEEHGFEILKKINLVYRCKFVVSRFSYILDSNIGNQLRKCYITILHYPKPRFTKDNISANEFKDITETEFRNANSIALDYYRAATYVDAYRDKFINLFKVIESLSGTEKIERKCENTKCKKELICKYCNSPSIFSATSKNLIRIFWIKKLNKNLEEIDDIIDMRQKLFHASDFTDYNGLIDMVQKMEISLGFYLTEGTVFMPRYLNSYRYHFEEEFKTDYPNEKFPRDFPNEDFFKKKHPEIGRER